MRRIVCEDCRKVYDYDKEDFCPRCGAFNQPVKTWTTDSQGNAVRVDGVNESTHAASFVHKEVHREKAVRRVTGMDQKKPRQAVPPRQTPGPSQRARPARKQDTSEKLKAFFVILAIILFFNLILPILMALW